MASLMSEVIALIINEGGTDLFIESRGTLEDKRDKNTILDALKAHKPPDQFAYNWYLKKEPLLWLADALCGITRSHLLGTDDSGYFELIQEKKVVSGIIYRTVASKLNA